VQALRESTDAKFDALSKKSDEQIDLLKPAFVHARKRIERLEREVPKTRRRRR
jgi:hypothetical protein